MSQIVWWINGANNKNRDYHYSLWLTSIIEPWVISWLNLSQVWLDISITWWEAIVEVTRTSLTPNESFCVAFISTATETITGNLNDYVYIEINPNRVDDPSLNVESSWTWIWQIKIWPALPTSNFIILGQIDWSWNIQNTWRQIVRLKEEMTSIDKITWWNYKILYTDWSWQVQELDFWTNGQVLGFTGVDSTPTPISPTVDINWLDEDITWNIEDDFFVKNDWWLNEKIKLTKYNASDIEASTWTNQNKYINPKQLHDNIAWAIKSWIWIQFWTEYTATTSWFVTWLRTSWSGSPTVKWYIWSTSASILVGISTEFPDSAINFFVPKWFKYKIDWSWFWSNVSASFYPLN